MAEGTEEKEWLIEGYIWMVRLGIHRGGRRYVSKGEIDLGWWKVGK